VALQRYRFDHRGHVQVFVDLQHGLHYVEGPTVLEAQTTALLDGVQGTLHRHNWVDRQVSFVVRFDHPVRARHLLPPRPGERAPRVILDFDLGASRELVARIALSTVDETGAARNLASADALTFDAIREAADADWNRLLNRIRIDGDRRTQTLFYSALYRTLQHPSDIADVDGRVRGPTGELMQAPGGVYYSTLSLWDTFRASHPLYTLIVPERVPGFVNTLIAHQQRMGYLPLWTSWGQETYCMIGNPALPVIADALMKGFGQDGAISVEAALAAMQVSSSADRPQAPEWAQRGWSLLNRYGYLPFDVQTGESVSLTAEYGVGDAALASVARLAGRSELAETYAQRAGDWQHLFDADTQTLRGRDSAGHWRQPFDPVAATSPLRHPGDYTEANAWQYTATPALHDPMGFRARLGGPQALEQWLDQFFARPIPDPDPLLGQEALIGQYAHGNEPSHHVTWLYAFTDAPEKGQRLREQIVRQFYSTRPDGIVGNDDVGQMSAWLVFALLGFYPAQPFSGTYVTGAPQVRSAVIDLGDGRTLSIRGHGLQPVLNGRPVDRTALSHRDLVAGGELRFQ
jgi:predicted alpha-1,2-mannosidase